MKKYLVLYQSEAALSGISVSEIFAQATPQQMKAGMDAWRAWYEKCGDSVVDLGTPLDKSTTLKDGNAAPTRSRITGYSILQANSMDEAVALMKGHLHFYAPSASVEVLECVPMPGM